MVFISIVSFFWAFPPTFGCAPDTWFYGRFLEVLVFSFGDVDLINVCFSFSFKPLDQTLGARGYSSYNNR